MGRLVQSTEKTEVFLQDCIEAWSKADVAPATLENLTEGIRRAKECLEELTPLSQSTSDATGVCCS